MKSYFSRLLSLVFILAILITCTKDEPVIQHSISVEVTPSDGGKVSPSSGTYNDGDVVSLKATPSEHYIFKNWLGGASGTDNPTSVIMNSDKNITAVFEKKMYGFNILYQGEGNVNVEVEGLNTDGTISSGSVVTLTASPEEGWEFVKWEGDITSNENPLTLVMDDAKEITAVFQPVLYNQIIGKWDVDNMDLLGSKSNSSNKTNQINNPTCIVYSIVFNDDGSFILSLNSGEMQGTFEFDSAYSIKLNDNGRFDNLHIKDNELQFHLNITGLCSIDGTADDDDDYVEGACVSFLNCHDGNVWVKQTETGFKYIKVINNLSETWIEQYSFNTNWECTSETLTNLTSQYNIILVENDIEKMTYVLDETPDGDVLVQLIITDDEHLSVNYDYEDDSLDETDYYDISTEESLSGYLNTYENCPQRTYVPDDNFEQALIDLGYDDVLDDYVVTANIEVIIKLEIQDWNNAISDLTGIEDFKNLEVLNLLCLKINILNLSENIKLKELLIWDECSIGDSSKDIITLNLSKNTNLENLTIAYNEQLSSIDVSKNTKLNYLRLVGNTKLKCIQVNQSQFDNIPTAWIKDSSTIYSLNCN